jgi:uncharacterized protein (UPF0303 family)
MRPSGLPFLPSLAYVGAMSSLSFRRTAANDNWPYWVKTSLAGRFVARAGGLGIAAPRNDDWRRNRDNVVSRPFWDGARISHLYLCVPTVVT